MPTSMLDVSQLPELEKLTDQMSELVHNWGFKRIHGKIWSLLYLSERPLDAADLITQLKISKALVSISVRELLDAGAVTEVGRSQRGTHLFRANTDITSIAMEVLRKREKMMLEATAAALNDLAGIQTETMKQFAISPKNLENLQIEIRNASTLLESLIVVPESQTESAHQRQEVITEPAEPLSMSASTSNVSTSESAQPSLPSSQKLSQSSLSQPLPYSARASGG